LPQEDGKLTASTPDVSSRFSGWQAAAMAKSMKKQPDATAIGRISAHFLHISRNVSIRLLSELGTLLPMWRSNEQKT
jgi:hypothetical protein